MLCIDSRLGVSVLWRISRVGGLTRFQPTTYTPVCAQNFQNVLHYGNNSVKIIIARSNLLNLGFFVCFVFSWCTLVDKLNTHVVNLVI